MNILAVLTGGTIGSIACDGIISPNACTKQKLISDYENIDFTVVEPYTILSETLCASNINALIECVKSQINCGYDGIIVTHGTDTLVYTACALNYAFADSDIPIMIVSSNYPLENEKSNGLDNFKASVEFIIQKSGKGVFIAYKNHGENVKFHCPQFALLQQETTDAINSISSNYYASLESKKVILNSEFSAQNEIEKIDFKLLDYPRINVIPSYPGNDYDYELSKCNAIIFVPYHSGTLNTNDEMLIDLCINAKNRDIPMYVINVTDGDLYESTQLYSSLGIMPLSASVLADTYVRLWIKISNLSNPK